MTPSERPRRKTYNKALESIHTYFKPKKRGGRSKKQGPEMKKVSPKKRPVGPARSSPRPPHEPFDDIVPGPSDYAIDVSTNSPVPGPSNHAIAVSTDSPVPEPSNYATSVSNDLPVAGPSNYATSVSTDPPVAGPSNDVISVSTNTIYYSCFSSPASSYITARQSFGSASTSNEQGNANASNEQDNVSIKQESIENENDDYYGINSSRWSPSTYQPPPRNSDSRSPMAPTPPPPSLLINYADAVVDLNLHRLQGQDCRIGANFFTTMRNEYDANIHGSDFNQLCLAWNFIRYVAGENRPSLAPLNYRRLEARFVPSVAAPEHYHTGRAVRARKCLIERTKIWMEDMWWEDMKRVVLDAVVVEPIMDGDLNWIYRYISITMMTSDLWVWNDDRLEIFSHIPIWAMVYYAFRCGRTEAILHYMRTHTDWFDSSPNIIVCFEDYLDNRPFSEQNQRWIEREELACHDNRGDPFKWMFLQLISRKYTPIPGGSVIIKDSYDNLWTHLNMIYEGPTFSRAPDYTLDDIQSAVRFYPNQDDNLLEVVHMNLMTFQFERAVHLLYENQDTRLHAVHMAITLMYYGLLRIPDTPTEHLLMDGPNGQATWDMKTMLDRYLQAPVNEGIPTTFQEMSPHYAIHYLALLTLYTSRNDYRNDDAISMSRSSVRLLLASIENENEFFANLQDHTEVYAKERAVAIQAVCQASKVCQSVFQHLVANETLTKNDKSPVTVADFSAQAIVNTYLTKAFPQDPIVGEEDAQDLRGESGRLLREKVHSLTNGVLNDSEKLTEDQILQAIDRGNYGGGAQGRHWALDPIDGTKGFLRGGQYAVCLALIVDGVVQLGVMGTPNLPIDAAKPDGERGTLFVAVRGQGAFQRAFSQEQETKIHFADIDNTHNATFCESVEAGHSSHDDASLIAKELGITRPSIRMDSQAKYCSLARGDADIYLRLPTSKTYVEKIWDHASGNVLITEAGGKVSDIHGQPLDFSVGRTLDKNSGVIAANATIFDSVLAAVQKVLNP